MPVRTPAKRGRMVRYAAPFAPLAIAVGMQATASRPIGTHGSFRPQCDLPFAGTRNAPIDNTCGLQGGSSDKGKQAESRAKNNFCAATASPREIAYGDLLQLQAKSKNLSTALPDRRSLQEMGEGDYVSYIGYIKQAHYSDVANGEAVNCNIPGTSTNDIHIVLIPDPEEADECKSTTAEMSPHYRPADWTPQNLNALAGQPVRVRGQLFFDGSHRPCTENTRPNPKRASVWEIHPVYSVDICSDTDISRCGDDEANWTTLSAYFSSETSNREE